MSNYIIKILQFLANNNADLGYVNFDHFTKEISNDQLKTLTISMVQSKLIEVKGGGVSGIGLSFRIDNQISEFGFSDKYIPWQAVIKPQGLKFLSDFIRENHTINQITINGDAHNSQIGNSSDFKSIDNNKN